MNFFVFSQVFKVGAHVRSILSLRDKRKLFVATATFIKCTI